MTRQDNIKEAIYNWQPPNNQPMAANDRSTRDRVLSGHTERLQPPAAILDDYWRRAHGRYPGETGAEEYQRDPEIAAALKQLIGRMYKYRHGYNFSWGQIVERRRFNLIFWEVVYGRLLKQMHWHRLGLPEIQRAAFEYLLAKESRFQADPWRALDIPGRFIVTPGTVYDAWCLVCHFGAENSGRRWLHQALGPQGQVKKVARAVMRCYLPDET